MMMELHQALPVEVEGKGKGYALAVIDYGQEHHLLWIVVLDVGGEIWTTPNPKVRLQPNWSMGRVKGS